jgi:protease-4
MCFSTLERRTPLINRSGPVALLAGLCVVASLWPVPSDGGAFLSASPIRSCFEGLRGRIPLWTAASPDDPLAVWTNPALLAEGRAGGFSYLHTFSDSSFSGDDAFSLCLGSLAFGAEFYDLSALPYSASAKTTERYTLASAQRLFRGVYFGTSYSWHSSQISELDDATTWSVGVLVRPHRMLSVGLAARDLNRPTYYGNRFDPIYEAAVAFRPVGERLTLFANCLARGDELEIRLPDGDGEVIETQPTSFLSYGVEAEVLRGLTLRIGADEDENLSASVSLAAGNAGIGSVVTRQEAEDGSDTYHGTSVVTASPFWRESPLIPRNGYLEIELDGSIGEASPPFSLMGGAPRYTLRHLLSTIRRAERSPEIRAILLKCTGVETNFPIIDELRQALTEFRASGKKVVAYTETPGNGEYCLATASDYIIITPVGYLGLVGLKAEAPFVRGTLEKLGLEAKYTKVGEYKSAVELLTQDQYSDASREAENAYLDDVYAKLVGDIAAGRGMTREAVLEAIDNGPYLPLAAQKAGLVDTAAYWDEVPDIVEKVLQAGSRSVPYESFARRIGATERWDEPPTIGIVYAVGSIVHGENRRELIYGDMMGSDTMTEAIRTMREDKSVKAVVFRVDSPGGEMTASDLIRREIELTAREKPVIVSMGGVAASGGYHISCDGTTILADETTVTGSIGVFNLWFHTRGLYQKLGVNKEIFTRGKHADPMPTWRDVTEEDLALMQDLSERFYERFVNDVATGRRKTYEEINGVARGRVWSGRAALGLGLVDKIGGLRAALDLAKQQAGIAPGDDVTLKVLPRGGGFLETILSGMQTRVLGGARLPDEIRNLVDDSAGLARFEEPFLYLMPYELRLE